MNLFCNYFQPLWEKDLLLHISLVLSIPDGTWVPVAVRRVCELLYPFTLA